MNEENLENENLPPVPPEPPAAPMPVEPVAGPDPLEPPVPPEKRRRRSRNHEHHDRFFFKFVISMILIIVLAAVIIFGIVYVTKALNSKEESSVTVQMTVESTLSTCQELVTSKYYYSQVDFIKRQNSNTNRSSSYVLLKYTGILRAGIEDLTACTFEYNEDEKSIKIYTPKIQILGNEISNYEVIDEYQKTFKTLSVKETMKELDNRKRQLENEAIESGFLQEAQSHAKLTLEKLFTAAGFTSVEVICPEIEEENEIVDYGVEVAPAR